MVTASAPSNVKQAVTVVVSRSPRPGGGTWGGGWGRFSVAGAVRMARCFKQREEGTWEVGGTSRRQRAKPAPVWCVCSCSPARVVVQEQQV